MAIVTGDLYHFDWKTVSGRQPVLRFHPHAQSGTLSRRDNRLLSHTPVDATITGTTWEINLVPTVGTIPVSWFELELIELGDAGEYIRSWWWGAKIHVPVEDMDFKDLPGGPLSPESVWVGLTPPPTGWLGYWLYSPAPGEEMPLDDPRIGDLIPGPGPFVLS